MSKLMLIVAVRDLPDVFFFFLIERFHSRDQQPYWITETKESNLHKNRVQFQED